MWKIEHCGAFTPAKSIQFSGIGYSGKEGMHIFRTPVARALEDRGPLPSTDVTQTSRWKGPKPSKQANILESVFWFLHCVQCAVLIHLTSHVKSCHMLECKTRPRTGLGILSFIQPLLVWHYTVHCYCQTGQAESIWTSEEKQPKKCTFLFSFGCCLGKIHTVSTWLCFWCDEHDVKVPTWQLQVANHVWIIFASQVDMAKLKTCAEVCREALPGLFGVLIFSPAFVRQY